MQTTSTEEILKAQESEEKLTEIIKNNEGLIWSIVKRFTGRGYEIEDLYQIGCMGFIKSIKRFDSSYNVKISTYAVPYILGEIKRFLRDDGPIKVSRSIKELAVKIKIIQKEYISINGEEIKIEELAKKLGVTKEEIAVALDSINPIDSIDEEIYKDDIGGESKINKINVQNDETSLVINKICINELIKKLDERDKKIIFLRYYKQKTQAEVARALGVTQVQISRLEKKILLSMRESLYR